jgi:hypothetical protein
VASLSARLTQWAKMAPRLREIDLERSLARRYQPVLTDFMVNGADMPGAVPSNLLVQFTSVGVRLRARDPNEWRWKDGAVILQHGQPRAHEGVWEYHFFCKKMTHIVTVLDKELAAACHYREVARGGLSR